MSGLKPAAAGTNTFNYQAASLTNPMATTAPALAAPLNLASYQQLLSKQPPLQNTALYMQIYQLIIINRVWRLRLNLGTYQQPTTYQQQPTTYQQANLLLINNNLLKIFFSLPPPPTPIR